MSCCCESKYQSLGGLLERPLMGAIPQQLPAIGGGSPLQFGFNEGILAPYQIDLEEMAKALEDQALSYDTRAYWLAGYVNRYITIEGYAVTTWQSGSDFGQAIYQALKGAGFNIDYGSIQFRFEPYYPPGQTAPPAMVGTPPPGSQSPVVTKPPSGSGSPPPPPGECDWDTQTFGDYIACQLGIKGAVAGATAGAMGALIGVGVLTVLGVVLLKR
jgi:hypothetical protein